MQRWKYPDPRFSIARPFGFGSGLALKLAVCLAWLGPLCISQSASPRGTGHKTFKPEFDRDIRPILAENCYPCHGPDEGKRKAKMRRDRKETALGALPNGDFPIVPGDLVQSKLVERISSKDPEEMMPPSKSGKKLTPEQIESLRQWIADGAVWQDHWSFVAPH